MAVPDVVVTRDSHSNREVARLEGATPTAVEQACQQAQQVLRTSWRLSTTEQRASLAAILGQKKDEIAELEARDTGKSLELSRADVEGAIELWQYAAGVASVALPDSMRKGNAITVREPMGVGMIVPWNYPLITTSARMPFALFRFFGCVEVFPLPCSYGPIEGIQAVLANVAGIE